MLNWYWLSFAPPGGFYCVVICQAQDHAAAEAIACAMIPYAGPFGQCAGFQVTDPPADYCGRVLNNEEALIAQAMLTKQMPGVTTQ